MATRHPYTGPNLRYYRNQRRLSLRELEALTGIAYTAIGKYERGESEMPYQNACKLAKALGIPVQLIWDHIPASAVAEKDGS